MGLVASSALSNGGEVHGIIPRAFLASGEKGDEKPEGENANEKGKTVNLEGERSKVTVVKSMHEVSRASPSRRWTGDVTWRVPD